MLRTKRDRDEDIRDGGSKSEVFFEKDYRPKKLRLILRGDRTATGILDEVCKCSKESSALHLLREFSSDFVSNIKPGECKTVCERLQAIVTSRPEPEVQRKAVNILKMILSTWGRLMVSFEADIVFQNILNLRNCTGRGGQFLALVLSLWRFLADSSLISSLVDVYDSLEATILDGLVSDFWEARRSALELLVRCSIQKRDSLAESPDEERQRMTEQRVCELMNDSEPRVREAAVRCLLEMGKTWQLHLHHYSQVCAQLQDSCARVRSLSLLLIKHFADSYPDGTVDGPNEGLKIRLVDDAFSRLCASMHDISARVRSEAATLLGQMREVSGSFLEQTLDKKLMSAMKVSKAQKDRSKFLEEWATGRRFGEDAPVERLEEESSSLIPSGACGAFVVGLEDEFMCVRKASVRSISALAVGRPAFAVKALDFLADMFNDEIEQVRLDAIIGLRHLIQFSLLDEDQMEIILNVLDDVMMDSRDALRDLLSHCRIRTRSALKLTVEALLKNLTRYPADKQSIWTCLKNLGEKHATLAQPLVPELISFHPFFHTSEPHIQNPVYVAKLVFALNAAAFCPPIKAFFAEHTWRHYRYLRATTSLVPALDHATQEMPSSLGNVGVREEFRQCLRGIHHKFLAAESLPSQASASINQLLIKDLDKVSSLDEKLSPAAELLRDCSLLQSGLDGLLKSVGGSKDIGHEWKRLWKLLGELCHLFSGVGTSCTRFMEEARLWLALTSLLFQDASALAKVRTLVNEMLDDRSGVRVELADAVRGVLEVGTESFSAALLDAFRLHSPRFPRELSLDMFKQKSCQLSERNSESGAVVRFVAGLVTSVELCAQLTNFSSADMKRIRIRVVYPDGREEIQRPQPAHFCSVGLDLLRLRTPVLLSGGLWNEPVGVLLEVVLLGSHEDDFYYQLVQSSKDKPKQYWISCRGLHSEPQMKKIMLFPKSRC